MKAKDIQRIRAGYKMSQAEFAEALGIPKRTLQNWEQGHQAPNAAAIALLTVAKARPATFGGKAKKK